MLMSINQKNYIWESVKFSFPEPIIRFGKGTIQELPNCIRKILKPTIPQIQTASLKRPNLLIVIGSNSLKNSGILTKVVENCQSADMNTTIFECGAGEANVDIINKGVNFSLQCKPDFVIGIGGGSVLDSAKAIAGIVTNGGTVQQYHAGKTFDKPGIPFIAIPTTAGTGSEITINAVITDPKAGIKQSIRGENLVAKAIILDPELTLGAPPQVTAYAGADALVQAIEAYVAKKSNPLTDLYAIWAIRYLNQNLLRVYEHGDDLDARSEMLLGSYFGGIAFSNAGLGLVHGFAHPIGYKYHIPHGKICALLLPWVIEYNMGIQANKYANIAKQLKYLNLLNKYEADASDEANTKYLINMIKELFISIGIPIRLRDLSIPKEDFDWIVANTKGGSVNSNPRTPDPASLKELLEKAW